MAFWSRRKSIDELASPSGEHRLKPSLTAWHLVLLGVGAIVGTGIYALIGVGAERAGPAIIIAFLIAGAVCACAALAYAELATMMPASGSAYTYAYASMGELAGWIVGWALILEYTVVCAAVAVGWSGYAVGFLRGVGLDLPDALTVGPRQNGIVNLPAIVIIAAVASLLLVGTRESATVNGWLVLVKISALAVFVALAATHFDPANFSPFMPFGFPAREIAENGETAARGVMSAAAITFFAFYGFDAVSTAAEETKDPGRNLSIGIIGSMAICTLIYMAVAAAAVGAMPFREFAGSGEPLAHILRTIGFPAVATGLAFAVVIGIPTVILAFMFGQSRIFFVMARDGLLPTALARLNRKGAPALVTIATAVVCSVIAGLVPLADIAALANAGTLAAFVATSAAVMILRRAEPARARPFRAPLAFILAPLAIAGCLYLFFSLQPETQRLFFVWMAIGLPVYFLFGAWNSRLAKRPA
jgi:APA family basic amino acid/polyamine antiporter